MDAAPSVRLPRDAVESDLDHRSERAEAEGRADAPAEAEVVSRLCVGGIGPDVVGPRSGQKVGLGSTSGGRDDEIAPYSPYSLIGVLNFGTATRRRRESAGEGVVHPIEPQADRQLANSEGKKSGYGLAFRVRVAEPSGWE